MAWMPGPIQSAPRFTVNNWKTENGLPQSTVLALTQTKDGFLWLGTLGGLARFDGIQFKVYNDGNTPGLKSGRIWRLFEDRQQRLWIALEKGGIVVATENGSLLKLPFDAASAELRLLSWCEDSAGSIWLQMSDKSLFVYTQNKLSLILRGCTRVMSDNSGLVWVGTENGNLVGLRFGDGAAVVQHELPAKNLDWLLSSRRGGYWRLADGKIQRWEADHASWPSL